MGFISELKDMKDVKRKFSQKQYEKETSLGPSEKWLMIKV